MAYYVQTMKVAPNTVTVIPSAWNQTTPWVRNTSDPLMGTFPDAVAFWANISVTKAQGDFAGYGTNGLFDFNCWSYEPTNIYTWYNQVKCDAVYDCNHQQQAGDGPDAPGPMESPEQEQDAKTANKIELGVGIGLGIPTLLVTFLGVWWGRKKGLLENALARLLRTRSVNDIEETGSMNSKDEVSPSSTALSQQTTADDGHKVNVV